MFASGVKDYFDNDPLPDNYQPGDPLPCGKPLSCVPNPDEAARATTPFVDQRGDPCDPARLTGAGELAQVLSNPLAPPATFPREPQISGSGSSSHGSSASPQGVPNGASIGPRPIEGPN